PNSSRLGVKAFVLLQDRKSTGSRMVYMKRMRDDEKGFTLAEVMVAMMILLVALLGLAQVQFTSIQGNAQSFSQVAATSLAQRAVEEFLALDGDDPD
ncbi:prepilin-type N-terminal cleavage/methylation domain-containing protein, partial [Nocardia farcinica]|nr:prepilin-type N-terminal cleavage/methylation domain-containing protein [Nocardia farcinica]